MSIWEREMGADDPSVANALTTIGRSSLGMENVREAIANLQRAFAIYKRSDPQPSQLAETTFLLAQAMWQKRSGHREAVSFALEAKKNYSEARDDSQVAEVTRWLETHDVY
jgi:hypothetical protein